MILNKFMKLAAIGMTVLTLVGCERDPEKTEQTSSSTVDILFTDSQGYTVKRFTDGGRYIYYVTGPTDSETTWNTGGKYNKKFTVETKK